MARDQHFPYFPEEYVELFPIFFTAPGYSLAVFHCFPRWNMPWSHRTGWDCRCAWGRFERRSEAVPFSCAQGLEGWRVGGATFNWNPNFQARQADMISIIQIYINISIIQMMQMYIYIKTYKHSVNIARRWLHFDSLMQWCTVQPDKCSQPGRHKWNLSKMSGECLEDQSCMSYILYIRIYIYM